MSDNLIVIVQDVYLAVDADQDPLTVDDIMHRAGAVQPLTVRERPARRNWAVSVTVTALTAAAVLIVVGLVPILMNRAGDVQPQATTVPELQQPYLGQGDTLEFARVIRGGGVDLFNTRNPVWFDGHLYVTSVGGVRIRSGDGVEWELPEFGSEWPADTPPDWPDIWEGKALIAGSGVVDTNTGETLIPPEAVKGMDVMFSEFGLVGVSTYDPQQVSGMLDAVFSADGTTWARWPLGLTTETSVEIVGIGDGFVVLGEWYSHSFWVAPLP